MSLTVENIRIEANKTIKSNYRELDKNIMELTNSDNNPRSRFIQDRWNIWTIHAKNFPRIKGIKPKNKETIHHQVL